MKLIVGLGNPGAKYINTKHNIGFLAVDYLVNKWNAQGPTQKNKGLIWQAKIDGQDALLIQPQTFMNLSGQCVAPIYNFYKCQPNDLIVIHDELDLDPEVLRIKRGGGNGGHNGLRSIDDSLGSMNKDYIRIRLGIGHPRRITDGPQKYMDVADYVLTGFNKDHEASLNEVFHSVEGAIRLCFQDKVQQAMNEYHGQSQKKESKE